jgi:hypothetical protein
VPRCAEGGWRCLTPPLHLKQEGGTWDTVVTLWTHCCYTVVTLLSHCCHTIVTLLSHCCHTVVTLLSHYCHTAVTLLSHSCYTVVTLLLRIKMQTLTNGGHYSADEGHER